MMVMMRMMMTILLLLMMMTLTSFLLPSEIPHGWPDITQVMLLSLRAAYA